MTATGAGCSTALSVRLTRYDAESSVTYVAVPPVTFLRGASIPAQPVFVHVGLPKTGTTHVQATFAANRQELADQGLLYPRLPRHPQHFQATLDFLQAGFGAIKPADVAGLWGQLADAVLAWPGSALVSHELLAGATADEVGRLVADFAPRDVHVIVGVRDLSRLLPAVWQERAKNRIVETWADFRAGAEAGPGATHAHDFWKLHDAEKVVSAWRAHVPDERIHVVTVPPSGSDPRLLLDRLAQVLGIDPVGFVVPDDAANASIGALELAVLREVNAVARQRIDRETYQSTVKRFLVPEVLARRQGQAKVTMPAADRAWLEAYTGRLVDVLGGGALDIVGELSDLTPTNISDDDPDDAAAVYPDAAVATALAETVVDLLTSRAREQAEARTARQFRRRPSITPVETPVRRRALARRLVAGGRRLVGRTLRRLRR